MNSMSLPQPPAAPRFGGLDGLRAIAVAAVLIYHFFPWLLPGGFLGVDIFFVVSGFLITSLLLREHEATGRIRLGAFWRRRARRLLPALVAVLLLGSSAALLVGGDVLVGIGAQIFGSLFFVSNWVFIARGADYFARDTPELFRNTWSLSIEEQFYVIMPLLLIVAIVSTSRFWRAMPFLSLTVGSATAMAMLAAAGEDPTRLYFGSGTHTFGLFMGVSLALLLRPAAATNPSGGAPGRSGRAATSGGRPAAATAGTATPTAGSRTARALARLGRDLVSWAAALAGLAVLAWLALTLREGSPESFLWGFQLASAAALLVVWAVTRPRATVGLLLDTAPFRWVGERSYGLYLWHWPVLVLVSAALPGVRASDPSGWIVGTLALLITLPLTVLSYQFLEQPVRRLGFRGALRQLGGSLRLSGAPRVAGAAILTLGLLAVPTTALAIVVAPAQTSAALAIARGQAALDAANAGTGSGEGAGAGAGADGAATASPPADLGPPDPAPPPPAPELLPPVTGDQVWAVGDSVMLASAGELQAALPGVAIDADVSRSFGAGVGMVQAAAAAGLRPVLVVGLATNGPVPLEQLEALRAATSGVRIVLVNGFADRWWIAPSNQLLADWAASQPGVVVADWAAAVGPYPELLAGDGIHPHTSGATLYAQTVQQALEALRDPDA